MKKIKVTSLNIIRSSFMIGLIGTYIAISLVPSAGAQTRPGSSGNAGSSGQALEIAPPVISLTADPGQTIKTQISLRNISGGNLIVTGQVNDFVAAGEDGTPKILMDGEEGNSAYSLKGWEAPLPKLLLVPKEIKTFPITFRVPANASPGGHYGVVRFTATPPELKGTGVSLAASLGSLVLVKINGATKEGLAVEEFSVNRQGKKGKLFESTPLQFIERLKNTGNVHEQPTGQITITDMFGKKIAAVNVNLQARNILPQSIRKFDQSLDRSVLGSKKLFGRYKATLKVTYGANKQELTSAITFWVIPYRLIGGLIAALVIGFFILRFALRRYTQRAIRKSQYSSRRRR